MRVIYDGIDLFPGFRVASQDWTSEPVISEDGTLIGHKIKAEIRTELVRNDVQPESTTDEG